LNNIRLVLVPRHIWRAKEILDILKENGLSFVRRSEIKGTVDKDTCIVVDTVGELKEIYTIADVVYIGGTLAKRGGQNPIEPAYLGKPIIGGYNFANFEDIAGMLKQNDAIIFVKNEEELYNSMHKLLTDEDVARKMGENARDVVEQNRGSLQRTVEDILKEFL
jgi:3-deoxy-D-manno-octulosonic-acid transferase